MTEMNYLKIKEYLRKEEEKLTNDIVQRIDGLKLPEKADISDQIWLHQNIGADLDRLKWVRDTYKTISELHLIEVEEEMIVDDSGSQESKSLR